MVDNKDSGKISYFYMIRTDKPPFERYFTYAKHIAIMASKVQLTIFRRKMLESFSNLLHADEGDLSI